MRTSVSCVILKIKPIDAVFFNTALLNTLRPCGLTFPRSTGNRKSAVPQNRPSPPVWPPEGPVQPVSTPGGERPVPARSGAGLGPTGASLAERKENGPTWKTAHNVDSEYVGVWLPARRVVSPKTSSGERCVKQAGERPGVAGGVPCRGTSPGRAGR